jgi:signal transduction histidine kinase
MEALRLQSVTYEDRYVIRQRSGTKRVISLSVAPMPASHDRPAGSVILFRDITAQDEMDRLQRELIAAISHELRAPLSHISSIAETLLDTSDSATIQPYQKYFVNLMSQTRRLAGFADRILDIYRMETGQLHLQLRPLPASLLVEDLVRQWQAVAPHHTISSRLPEKSPWLWADETSVKTVLSNLVDNAVKYSPHGTAIEISAQPGPNGFVTLAVRDQGAGIPPEHQPKIFQRFYRVDGRDAQTVYGHGLGLYIAKNLVEAMKGQIWVESELDRGSCFAFFLPSMEANNEGKDPGDR